MGRRGKNHIITIKPENLFITMPFLAYSVHVGESL